MGLVSAAGVSRLKTLALSPAVAACTAMFFWAFSMVLVGMVRGEVPPIGLSFWRTLTAFAIVVPFAARQVRRDLPILRAHWPILALLGFLLFVLGNGGLFIGLQDTTVINAALVNSFEPILIVLVGTLLFRDAITLRQGIGVAVSLGGVLALITRTDPAVIANLDVNRGDLWVLAGITAWALYAVLLRRSPRGLHFLSQFAALAFFGLVFLLPCYIFETIAIAPTRATVETVTVVVILAVFSTLVAVMLWNRAIRGLGSGRAGLFIHLIPVYSVILATILLSETLEPYHGLGIVLIGIGIWLATLRRSH